MYIRADGNEKIATGHIMRCLAIAEALREKGEDSVFIIADEYPKQMIAQRGFSSICLFSVWDNLESEIEKMIELIQEKNITKLLIDTYYATDKYLEILSTYTDTIYVDDFGKKKYPVSSLINYVTSCPDQIINLYSNKNIKLLLGRKYSPLRKEFFYCTYTLRNEAKKVFVTTGGTDKYDIALRVAQYVVNKDLDMELCIIAGRFCKSIPELQKLSKDHQDKISVVCQAKNMAELMQESDVAISAGGTTLFELCACGIPTVCFAFADNQLGLVKQFGDNDIMINIGDIRIDIDNGIYDIIDATKRLLKDSDMRRRYSQRMQRETDGKGAIRIANELMEMKER